MTDKVDYYDILGVAMPGILLLTWIPICFPSFISLAALGFPDAFTVLCLAALAVFMGHIVQAIAKILEPAMYWSWQGRPSDRILKGMPGGFLPKDSVTRIKSALAKVVDGKPSDHSLFLFAMQKAETARNTRVTRFNSIYTYHRSLLVLIFMGGVLLVASMFWGQAASWLWQQKVLALSLIVALLVLIWHRTKQRAYYYVREVLLTAEQVLSERRGEKEA